ncbi:MAG: DAK2 domain-containing protein, partial [Bacilli bacterium]|nr:DAK2 domain-containing protein [Bacilli bacterium]
MNTLTGRDFEAMVRNGYRDIKLQYQKINDLNVFPVPDGDTGTNITATMTGGIKSMEKADLDDISDVSSKLAAGMLLGARGNSGVIVSQFFQGLAEGLQGLKTATIPQFISALNAATSKAYQAVVHPVEGTILTVAREGTDYLSGHADEINDFEFLFTNLLREMSISLDHTPELLPVLKEAGVIDSGGAGLVAIIEGMGKEIKGEQLEESEFHGPQNSVPTDGEIPFDEDSELEYGYCTEFILQLLNCKNGPKDFQLKELIRFLETIGDSIVALRQKNIVKIHVHTKEPWRAMRYAQQYGEFITWKMENMSIQHNEVLLKEMPIEEKKRVKHAIISVAPSKEIAKLFTDMGVNEIISGGQTMNPSAEDFVRAFEDANADEILVFPNNSNIILTA